jgi:hypothetical protein
MKSGVVRTRKCGLKAAEKSCPNKRLEPDPLLLPEANQALVKLTGVTNGRRLNRA